MATFAPPENIVSAPFPPEGSGIDAQEWAQGSREDRITMLMEADRPAAKPGSVKVGEVKTTAERPKTEAAAPPDFERRKEALLRLAGARGDGLTSPVKIT